MTPMPVFDPVGIAQGCRAALGPNDLAFLARVFSTPPETYERRLRAIGFAGLGRVLDAGCGFGQWTLALARLNREVHAVDVSPARVAVVRALAAAAGAENVTVSCAPLEALPPSDGRVDGCFCYGTVFCTDWRRSLRELARTLAPGGLLYLTANGSGWYLHLWHERPNAASDYDPRETAAEAFARTLAVSRGCANPPPGNTIIEPDELRRELRATGLRVHALRGEGRIRRDLTAAAPVPFFRAHYHGLVGVYEALASRPG